MNWAVLHINNWQEGDIRERRAEGQRCHLGSSAFSAKHGGSSAFPLKMVSPLPRPPAPMIWGLRKTRCGPWVDPCMKRSGL